MPRTRKTSWRDVRRQRERSRQRGFAPAFASFADHYLSEDEDLGMGSDLDTIGLHMDVDEEEEGDSAYWSPYN